MLHLHYNQDGFLSEAHLGEQEIYASLGTDYNREKGYYDSPNFNAVSMSPKHIEQYKGHDMRWNDELVKISLDESYHRSKEISSKFKHIELVK